MAPALLLVLVLGAPAAAHPPASAPLAADPVVASVPTRDAARISALGDRYELLGYRWRTGEAIIRADPRLLPPDASTDDTWREHERRLAPRAGRGIAGFPCYRTVAETETALAGLAAAHPTLAVRIPYGQSWERVAGASGSELQALVITNQEIAGPKPVLMVMATMHPRELAVAEAATRFAEWLVAGYGVEADRTWMIDHLAIHVLAQHNPDGRRRVEEGFASGNRALQFWRKNTNDAYCPRGAGQAGPGADLNRNAATMFWGGALSGGLPCDDLYRGPVPASEPETAALEAWVAATFPDQRDGGLEAGAPPEASGMFLSVHSFGEFVYYPWEGTDRDTGNERGYRALAQRMAHLSGYASCQNCCIGPVGGTAVDQVYEAVGAASLTIELGTWFFDGCRAFEERIWPEARAIFTYAARTARRPYRSSLGPRITQLEAVPLRGGAVRVNATASDGDYRVSDPCPPARTDPPVEPGTVARVLLTVDAPPWATDETLALAPTDGAWDATIEAATGVFGAQTFPATGERVMLFAVAEDSAGNRGPPAALFLPAGALFADGFEGP